MTNLDENFYPIEEQDAVDSYFECITACSLSNDGIECVTKCVEIHLKGELES